MERDDLFEGGEDPLTEEKTLLMKEKRYGSSDLVKT